ncbi:MAG: energy-coupling factor ABC transporter ATP-binding protein [Thermomicrobiales bacterium]|nr:energy-coupling factor ABC transporter ATP-binding protein [Thermomicrobiales bacterium]
MLDSKTDIAERVNGPSTGRAIDVTNLSYTYPNGFEALRSVSLTIHEGERVALMGPNGAGKSTLLMHLNGVLTGQGSIEITGIPLDESSVRQIRALVGFVFQNPDDQLFSPTVFDDIAYGPLYMGLAKDEIRRRVVAALAAVDMVGFEERMPHHLSLGQRKRISVATVLAMDPRILVLDEPSAGLDPRARKSLIELLRALPQTLIASTHDMRLVRDLFDRAVIMQDGRIVVDAPTSEVISDEALLDQYGLELP